MPNKLTAKKVKQYVKQGGMHCPYCNSKEIESCGSVEVDGSFGYQNVRCCTCDAEWTDEYTLTGISSFVE